MLDAVRTVARRALRSVARDTTDASTTASAVVLAPHPDDETLGCGATILRKTTSGTSVTVVVLTDGRHSHRSRQLSPQALADLRRDEMAEAARRLGLPADAVRWAGFVDGTLPDHEAEVETYIRACLAELRPREVYATCAEEPHPDHAVVGRAARRAVAATGGDTVLLEYPVWLWGSWPLRRGDRLGSTVDFARRLLDRRAVKVRAQPHLAGKMHALRAHASQLGRPGGIPADEEWAPLPPALVATAGEPDELFLPGRRQRVR